MGDATIPCRKCEEIKKSFTQEGFTVTLKEPLERCKQTFLKAVNALVNMRKGGNIIVHTNTPKYLGQFHQEVDDNLKKLLPSDVFYHDVFPRRHFEDKNHLVFRVKRLLGEQLPVSTLKFHSKVSLNKGRDYPTQLQMRKLVQLATCKKCSNVAKGDPTNKERENRDETDEKHEPKEGATLTMEEQEPCLGGEKALSGDVNHPGEEKNGTEPGSHQSVMKKETKKRKATEQGKKLPQYKETNHQDLTVAGASVSTADDGPEQPNFIDGESVKYRRGTHFHESLCIQIKDIHDKKLEKLRAADSAQDGRVSSLTEHFWDAFDLPGYISAFSKIDKGGSVYFGITETQTKDKEEKVRTEKFKCNGFRLDENERSEMEKKIEKLVVEDMVWVGSFCPKKPVVVKFHPILEKQKQGPAVKKDWFVIEVRVNYFRGLCFYKKEEKRKNEKKERQSKTIKELSKSTSVAREKEDIPEHQVDRKGKTEPKTEGKSSTEGGEGEKQHSYIVPVAYWLPPNTGIPERISLEKWIQLNGGCKCLKERKPIFS